MVILSNSNVSLRAKATCSKGAPKRQTFTFIIQILTNALLLFLSVTSMQLALTMTDPTTVLARLDFPVTGKLAKVGNVVSEIISNAS